MIVVNRVCSVMISRLTERNLVYKWGLAYKMMVAYRRFTLNMMLMPCYHLQLLPYLILRFRPGAPVYNFY